MKAKLLSLAVLLWIGAVSAANASTFTVQGTFSNSPALLSGTLTIDETSGQITAGDLIAGSLPAFTNLLSSEVYSQGEWRAVL